MQEPVAAPQARQDEESEINLLALLGTCIDHRWLIASVTATFMLLGVAYALLATPIYQASALIQVESKKSGIPGLSDVSDMLGQESETVTEIELIKSRAVIGKAVDNLHLDISIAPKRFPIIGGFIARGFHPTDEHAVAAPLLGMNSYDWGGAELRIFQLDLPESLLSKKLTLTAGDNNTFTLDYNGTVLAQGPVGQPVSANGLTVQVESLRANPGTVFSILKSPRFTTISVYQLALQAAERGKKSGIIGLALENANPRFAQKVLNEIAKLYVRQNVERMSAEAANSLAFLKDQLPQVKRDVEHAEAAMNAFQVKSQSVDLSLETKSLLDQIVILDTNLSNMRLQQAEMDRKFTASHPVYQALMTQIQQVTEKRKALADKIQNLPETQKELLSLTRDLQVSTQIYTQLLSKAQELDVVRAGTVGNVRIIDDADVDPQRIRPKRALTVLIATLLGGILGIALALLRQAMNRSVQSPDAIEQLGLPVYTTVPFSALQAEADVADEKAQASRLLTVQYPTDLAAEALRSLRTSLHFAMLEAPNNRLMISGPSPGVGKTFISANLAVIIAQSGKRVLIIDADMRKGTLHKYFRMERSNGLSDLLSEQINLDTALRKTELDNLDCITAGQIPPNPSELLMHENFRRMLDEVSPKYDFVLVDTPPILAVTDAAIVGKLCGAGLLITRFDFNTPHEINAALRRFAQNGIQMRGAVLNAVRRKASAYYGAYGYGGYGYGYGGYGYGYSNYQYEYKSDSNDDSNSKKRRKKKKPA